MNKAAESLPRLATIQSLVRALVNARLPVHRLPIGFVQKCEDTAACATHHPKAISRCAGQPAGRSRCKSGDTKSFQFTFQVERKKTHDMVFASYTTTNNWTNQKALMKNLVGSVFATLLALAWPDATTAQGTKPMPRVAYVWLFGIGPSAPFADDFAA